MESAIGGAKVPAQNGRLSDDIRFVHSSGNGERILVGPVLMEFGDYSGGAQPSVLIRGASIWIFDDETERGAEVLRISTSTGAILQRAQMPAISRPVICANQFGFWMGQAINSFYGRGVIRGVWFAALGSTSGVLVRGTGSNIWAMKSVGTTMEVDVAASADSSPTYLMRWRFTPVDS